MAKSNRQYVALLEPAWRTDRAAGLPMFRCGNCSVEFGVEPTFAGPACCPGCGIIFEPREELAAVEQVSMIARAAQALGMQPSTLLYLLRTVAIVAKQVLP